MQAGEAHDVLGDQVGFLLRPAYQRHSAIYAPKAPGDIMPAQFSVLYRPMRERTPVSHSSPGRLVGTDAANAKGVIVRHLAHGLIDKATDEEDRRRHTLSITGAGRALIRMHVPSCIPCPPPPGHCWTQRNRRCLLHP